MRKLEQEQLKYEAANEVFIREGISEDYKEILELINLHKTQQVPRLEQLNRYYLGRNDGILQRAGRKGEDKADYRASHPFAENITTFRTSYLVGNPVKTEFRDKEINYDDANQWFELVSLITGLAKGEEIFDTEIVILDILERMNHIDLEVLFQISQENTIDTRSIQIDSELSMFLVTASVANLSSFGLIPKHNMSIRTINEELTEVATVSLNEFGERFLKYCTEDMESNL